MRRINPITIIRYEGDGVASGNESRETAPVLDFRPRNQIPEAVFQEPANNETQENESDPKGPDSSATGSASDSENGTNENSTPESSPTPSQTSNLTNPFASTEPPAPAAKVKLLHPSVKSGKNEQPAGE